MSPIETSAVIIIIVLSFPRLCNMVRHPSLLSCLYLLAGVILSSHLTMDTRFMLDEVGKIGFTLLLFLSGLEIELPSWRVIKKPVVFCVFWLSIQIPMVMIISNLFNFGLGYGWIAAAGIILVMTLVSRYILFQQCFGSNFPKKTFLLFYPNITMASVAAELLSHNHYPQEHIDLLVFPHAFEKNRSNC